MGTSWTGLLLCIFIGDFIAAQYMPRYSDDGPPPGVFETFRPFPLDRSSDFMPYNSLFGSWKTPNFNTFADLPAMMSVPRVEVFCDGSMLTLVVDKRSFRRRLSRGELQLGEGCYSNAELPNKFVFLYSLDQCGTTHVIQDGVSLYTNSLHLNFKRPSANWWQMTPPIHISCIPKRSYDSVPRTPSASRDRFTFKSMTPSWSDAQANVYQRGQVVNLQVSGQIGPDQQLFIQSCFVSASPEPQTRPRHAVILNKGCATSAGSPHPIAQFVASNRADEVNLILNTSHLISELYIHCSVLVSDQAVTCGSKSCNYNVIKSRWEDLSGDVDVCDCCSSKCRGLSVKNLPDAKVTVSMGPLVIVDTDAEMSSNPASDPEDGMLKPAPTPTEAALPHPAEDVIVSGTSVLPRQDVVMVRKDPGARQTLWLPGQVHITDNSKGRSAVQQGDGTPSEQPPTTQRRSPLNLLNKGIERRSGASKQAMSLPLLVNGWAIRPQQDIAFIVEEFEMDKRLAPAGEVDPKAMQDDNFLPTEVNINYLIVSEEPTPSDFHRVAAEEETRRKKRFLDEAVGSDPDQGECVMAGCATDLGPVIRTKIEFTKGVDGSKKLSYEEDARGQQGGRREASRFGRNVAEGRRQPKLEGLHSTFLYLLRRIDNAE